MRVLIFALLLCSSTVLLAQQEKTAPPQPQPRETRKLPSEDVQALREDLDRMKALVQQMESNLAFVETTQSPLKHQFQLEIDMWRTVIASMERRLAAASR